MTDNHLPPLTSHQDAWLEFISEVQPEIEVYDQAVKAANAARDAAFAAADLNHREARHRAWEAHTDAITYAWREYITRTQAARGRREMAELGARPLDADL